MPTTPPSRDGSTPTPPVPAPGHGEHPATSHHAMGALPAWIAVTAATIAVVALLHRRVAVLDVDSFHHHRHARHYLSAGPLDPSFPWIRWSVMHREGGDIWYGFHLLLAPFVATLEPVASLDAAGTAITCLALLSFALALARSGVRGWGAWPALLLVASPQVLSRLLMVRPHVMTLAIAALLWSLLCRGAWPAIFAASFALGWVHLSLFWLAPLLAAVVLPLRALGERRLPLGATAAVLAGTVTGMLARPAPFGALRIDHAQLVRFLAEKRKGTPLPFGQELSPLPISELASRFAPLALLWLAGAVAAAVLLRRRPGGSTANGTGLRVALPSALVLSTVFLAMTLGIARRAYDLWALFTLALLATALEAARRGSAAPPTPLARRAAWLAPLLAAAALATVNVPRVLAIRGYDAAAYRRTCDWLVAHSRRGDIVYHLAWFTYPQLVFWNEHNTYVAGIDPIFQHALSEDLSWKGLHLQRGVRPGWTCGAPTCAEGSWEDAHTVLRRDFDARYLLVEARHHPMFRYARDDPRFALVLQDGDHALFEVRDGP